MVPIKSMYFVSGSKRLELGEKYSGLYGNFLSLNGRNSANFDNTRLKYSRHGYFEAHFLSMLPNMRFYKEKFYKKMRLKWPKYQENFETFKRLNFCWPKINITSLLPSK